MLRHQAAITAPSDKARLLHLLARPGCIYCSEEREALDRFFAWYVIEQYAEPETCARLRRAGGFCREHTRVLVARALPSQLTAIYQDLIASGGVLLRTVEHMATSAVPSGKQRTSGGAAVLLAQALTPQEPCPACASQARARAALTDMLRQYLPDQEVRTAMGRASNLCLAHLLEITPALDWFHLRFLSGEVRKNVAALPPEDPVGTDTSSFGPSLALLRGAELRCLPAGEADDETARSAPTDQMWPHAWSQSDAPLTSPAPGMFNRFWSPTIASLGRQLQRAACPLCLKEHEVVADYVSWAISEWASAPPRVPDQILWLCRQHSWIFAHLVPVPVVAQFVALLCAYWVEMLTQLEQDLAALPAARVLPRLWHTWMRLRAQPESRTFWRRARLTWEQGTTSRAQLLAARRSARLRGAPCPICRAQRMHVDRLSDLVARSLRDPETQRIYRNAQGVCFRHLVPALQACREVDEVRVLLREQRVHFDVVHWELEEVERKRNWSVRWEPAGSEASAWRRAIAQYSGSFIVETAQRALSQPDVVNPF